MAALVSIVANWASLFDSGEWNAARRAASAWERLDSISAQASVLALAQGMHGAVPAARQSCAAGLAAFSAESMRSTYRAIRSISRFTFVPA